MPHETHAQLHVHARVYSPCTYRAPARVHTPVRTHRRVRRSTPRRSSVPIQQGSFRHRADRALIVGRSGTRSTRFFIICCTNFFLLAQHNTTSAVHRVPPGNTSVSELPSILRLLPLNILTFAKIMLILRSIAETLAMPPRTGTTTSATAGHSNPRHATHRAKLRFCEPPQLSNMDHSPGLHEFLPHISSLQASDRLARQLSFS